MRVPQPPQPHEDECEDGGPAQQSVVAVDEERHEPVGPFGVAAREMGIGGRLAGEVGRIRRQPAVERLVNGNEERRAEARHLGRADREGAPPSAPQRAKCEVADHESGRHELRPKPRQDAEQREAAERLTRAWARAEPQREQGGPRQAGGGAELRVDGGPIGDEGGRQPDRERRAEGPRVGRDSHRQPVAEGHRQRRHRCQEELDTVRAADGEGGSNECREADAVRLVEPPVGCLAVLVERVGVEARVGARRVLVGHVDVAVLHERLRREQVVRLVAGVVGVSEGMKPEGGRVGSEQQQEEGGGPSHRGQQPSCRAMIICWTSSVPSPIVRIFASR